MPAPLVGRLAPSPTGAQHVGNARTYLLAWLSIRARGGTVIVRIEDIDSPRVKSGAAQQALDDLRWLGLDWDQAPDAGGNRGLYVQSDRLALYREALDQVVRAGRCYPCTCSRSDVAAAASAPHTGQEGPVYPGTCARRQPSDATHLADRAFCWRYRTSHAWNQFEDLVRGPCRVHLARQLGDFVVARAGGLPAYQLAVVVDDHAMGVTEVLRGDDLVTSTFRQIELYRFFDWMPPQFAHVPLVVGPDGRRLAKRHGDTRLAQLRSEGLKPEQLVGVLAWSCGLLDRPQSVSARELIPSFDLSKLPREPLVWTDRHWEMLRDPRQRLAT